MISRFAIAAAGGATMFGLAGAGASLLGTSSDRTPVQQANAIFARCQPRNVSFADVVAGTDIVSARLSHQSIEPNCDGDFVQVALSMANGAAAYSNTVWIPTFNVISPRQESFLLNGSTDLASYGYSVYGRDLSPRFPAGVLACAVASTTIIVVGKIETSVSSSPIDESGSVTGALPTTC
jgi:hypothetical protein